MTRSVVPGLAGLLVAGAFAAGCSSLTLTDVDQGWPVEAVTKVGRDNRIADNRYALSARVTPLAIEEFQDSSALIGKDLRVLRNHQGYYFVTGQSFKNVYVFDGSGGAFSLSEKIEVSQAGLSNPALNQRTPYVELVDGSLKMLLDADGVVKGGAQ